MVVKVGLVYLAFLRENLTFITTTTSNNHFNYNAVKFPLTNSTI